MLSTKMELDAIRFYVGPWDDRYSSVWRVWSNPGKHDLFLGVRSIAGVLKVSLHQSGIFKAAFTKEHHRQLIEEGERPEGEDKAFMRWERGPLVSNQIVQVLDVHFPLPLLSIDKRPEQKKTTFEIRPHDGTIGENDTITVKVLCHDMMPDSQRLLSALNRLGVVPFF